MKIVLLLTLLAACGPNHKKVCDTSKLNREEGRYKKLDARALEQVDSDFTHSCLRACFDDDSEACAEADMLQAEGGDQGSLRILIDRCTSGISPSSCAWMEQHADKVAAYEAAADAARAQQDAADQKKQGVVESGMDPATFAAQMLEAGVRAGAPVVHDQSYYVDGTYASFSISVTPGDAYKFWVIGSAADSFDAKVDAWDYEPVVLYPQADVPRTVRSLNSILNVPDGVTEVQVVITGGPADVRAMVFQD